MIHFNLFHFVQLFSVEIANNAEITKTEESKTLTESLQIRIAKEKEMQTAIDDNTAALEEARYELREANARINYQKGRIAELETDVVSAQQQLRERQRIERRLINQLDSAPQAINDNESKSPSSIRKRLAQSEAQRAELSENLLNILRRENETSNNSE